MKLRTEGKRIDDKNMAIELFILDLDHNFKKIGVIAVKNDEYFEILDRIKTESHSGPTHKSIMGFMSEDERDEAYHESRQEAMYEEEEETHD